MSRLVSLRPDWKSYHICTTYTQCRRQIKWDFILTGFASLLFRMTFCRPTLHSSVKPSTLCHAGGSFLISALLARNLRACEHCLIRLSISKSYKYTQNKYLRLHITTNHNLGSFHVLNVRKTFEFCIFKTLLLTGWSLTKRNETLHMPPCIQRTMNMFVRAVVDNGVPQLPQT